MCLIFLSLCVLKMGNRVREQDPHTVCEVWPPQFPSSEKLLLARGLVCLLLSLSLSLVLIYVNYICLVNVLVLLVCASGFASVSVFRNWVFVIACGFAKIKVIF